MRGASLRRSTRRSRTYLALVGHLLFALSTQQSTVWDGDVKAKTAFGIVSHRMPCGMDLR